MRNQLQSDGRRRAVTLQGLGGIGKTQLSIAYMDRYRDAYTAIFWINCKDKVFIRESFTKMRWQILEQHNDTGRLQTADPESNPDGVVTAVKAWLSLPNNTRWLIVYDNHDDPESIDINGLLPEARQGSIIVTTRSLLVKQGHRIQMKKLRPIEDGLKILSLTSGQHDLEKNADAKELAKELDGLPLALGVAGAYLERVCISPGNYLDLYKEKWASFQPNTSSLDSYRDRTLCSTWQVSYDKVQKQNPLAGRLLRWWAYFNNEDLWFELFQHNVQHGSLWLKQLADRETFFEAVGTLREYGLVEPHTSSTKPIEPEGYSIHACLHAWSLHVLNREDNGRRLGKLALEYIAQHAPSLEEPKSCLLQRRLLPHAALMSCADFKGNDQDLGWAFHQLGILLLDQGRLQESQEMYLRALELAEEKLGPAHPVTLNTANGLAVLYRSKGKFREAAEMFQWALKEHGEALESDDPSVLLVMGNLGNLIADQGKFQEAEQVFRRVLKGYRKVLGPDDPLTILQMNNLGCLLTVRGELHEAQEVLERALTSSKQQDAHMFDTLNHLGNVLLEQGRLQEAQDMLLRALEGNEKALGPGHVDTLETVGNLGCLFQKQDKLKEAEKMHLRALGAYEKSSGFRDFSKHLPAVRNMWNLGNLSRRQGQLSEAREYCQRACTDLEGMYGSSHSHVELWRNELLDLDRTMQANSVPRDEPTVASILTQD